MSLGPPTYAVYVAHRGGDPLTKLPWTRLDWGRELDDTSSASVTVPVSDPNDDVAFALANLEAWAYELSIWRYITDQRFEEVWAGPITEPTWTSQGVQIAARDLTEWFERRVLPADRIFVKADLATIFASLAADALSGDTSPGIVVTTSPTNILGNRTVKAKEHKYAADALRELARDGLDYTAIGRTLLIGGVEVSTRRLPPLTDKTLLDPQAAGLGLSTATKVHVLAGAGSQDPIASVTGGVSGVRGLVERVFLESDIVDASSAGHAASTRWEMLNSMPLSLSGTYHTRRGPQIDQLVPGALARAQLSVGVRSLDVDVRLARVRVSATSDNRGIEETVKPEFVPVGSESL